MMRRNAFRTDAYDFNLPMQMYQGLVQRGYAPHRAAGIVGNAMVEGSLRGKMTLDQHQKGGGGGYGLFQLTDPSRKAGLQTYANQHNAGNMADLNTQLGYMDQELNTTYRGARDALNGTGNVRDATLAFMNKYERPGVPHTDWRLALADEVYKRGTNGNFPGGEVPLPPTRPPDLDQLAAPSETPMRPTVEGQATPATPVPGPGAQLTPTSPQSPQGVANVFSDAIFGPGPSASPDMGGFNLNGLFG